MPLRFSRNASKVSNPGTNCLPPQLLLPTAAKGLVELDQRDQFIS